MGHSFHFPGFDLSPPSLKNCLKSQMDYFILWLLPLLIFACQLPLDRYALDFGHNIVVCWLSSFFSGWHLILILHISLSSFLRRPLMIFPHAQKKKKTYWRKKYLWRERTENVSSNEVTFALNNLGKMVKRKNSFLWGTSLFKIYKIWKNYSTHCLFTVFNHENILAINMVVSMVQTTWNLN